MQKKWPLSTLVPAFLGLAACLEAAAIGFGRAPQSAVLGQPLDFVVNLRLDAGEFLAPECISAEVTVGEQRVPPGSVRATLEERGAGSALVRVVTSAAIDEPVVTVQVDAGCAARVSRRFVLLVDPPAALIAAPALMMLVADTTNPTTISTAVPTTSTQPQFASPIEQPPARGAEVNAAPASRPVLTQEASSSPAVARTRVVAAAETPRPGAVKRPRKTVAPATLAKPAAAVAVAEAVPRLRLDVAEPVSAPDAAAAAAATAAVVEDALLAVEAAASAARAAAVAASTSAQRIASLERAVEQLRAESAVNRAAAQGAANAGARWFTPLLLAMLALLGLVGWLTWQLRTARLSRQRAWFRAAAAEARPGNQTSPIPLVTSEIELPAPRPEARPAWPAPVVTPVLTTVPPPAVAVAATASRVAAQPAATAFERTEVLPPDISAEDGAARDVSIDELLDLEQQADFFVALGQDEAAVDLLVDHLRGTGGGSPLPYLKLLEIYRRRDDRDAYERTRTRFNDRFNAYAPEWERDLQSGRTLDDYPGLVQRLQQVWPRPLDAMAELEALLFRKSRGDLFDLPAYREVLFLYSLARDLLEREPTESVQVDILLPLADGGEFSSTAPGPFIVVDGGAAHDPPGGHATAPVDLELFDESSSAFGDIFGKPPPRKS